MPDNTIEWGQGAVNNTNDWGKAKANSTNNFGAVYDDSPSGDTNIAGGSPAPPALAQVNNVYSMAFDGTNDFIDAGNDSTLNISGDLTISAWVNISTHKDFNGIISKISSTDRNYEILVRTTGQVSFYTMTSGNLNFTTSTTTIPVNTWTHVVVTVESGVANGTKFYFNGIQDATTGIHTVAGNTANANIGRRTTNAFYMNGKIDEVSIFNVELTAQEVQNIYNATETGKTADLNDLTTPPVAWYRM